MKRFEGYTYVLLCFMNAMVGYTIHHSIFWSIMDYFFMPFALIKWVITHEINLSIIKETFSFLSLE